MESKFLPRNKNLKNLSSELRKNSTPQENKLWYEFLRMYPVRFNRQRIIGNFIADFYCDKAKLVIEIDGSQHFETENISKDSKRTEYFKSLGISVLRFANNEINENFYEVCSVIDKETKNRIESF